MNRIWLWCITMLCFDTWVLVQFVSDTSSWRTLLGWLAAHLFVCLFFSAVFSKALCAQTPDRVLKLTVVAYCVSICLPILGMVGMLVLIAPSLFVGGGLISSGQAGQHDGLGSPLGYLINATVAKCNRMYQLPIGRQSQHEIRFNMPITGVVYGVAPEMCGAQGPHTSPLVAKGVVKVPGSAW
jgi:hypothetical protein